MPLDRVGVDLVRVTVMVRTRARARARVKAKAGVGVSGGGRGRGRGMGRGMGRAVVSPNPRAAVTSGTTSGHLGSIRKTEELSTTTQPAAAALGAYSWSG